MELADSETKDDLTPEQRRTLRRAITASAMGNATEWYDFSVYAYLASTMGAVFFPDTNNPVVSLLGAYGVFAVSFLIRPLGGIVLGPLGDRLGRQRVLALTILMMAGSTLAIGLLPSYATIGIAAPILLIVCRLIQGFSTGGEYGGAATFMAEYAPNKRRGFIGSFLEFGTLGGYIFGAGVVTVCTLALGDADMQSWGWRIPFLIAGPLGVVGLYLRTKLEDTPVFRELAAEGKIEKQTGTQFRDLAKNWAPILVCMGMVVMLNVCNYTLLTYMPEYLQGPLRLDSDASLLLTIGLYVAMLCVITSVGKLSDRVGRKPLWYVSGVGLLVLSLPAFQLMDEGWVLATIGLVVLGLLLVLQLGTISATFPALFPTHIRYAGFAISYNVATSLFGGTAPLINTALIDSTGDQLIPAYYMMAACVVGLIALWFAPETARASLRGTEQPSTEATETAVEESKDPGKDKPAAPAAN
jgi:MHS family proline/betaine transporter-like MFS transporter